ACGNGHGGTTEMERSERTSERMRRVGTKNTAPEMRVRKLLHSLGYRYRIHAHDLPGSTDIVFRGRKKAIFVHGCFWHRHEGCKRATTPATRRNYWQAKFDRNVQRDQEA